MSVAFAVNVTEFALIRQ